MILRKTFDALAARAIFDSSSAGPQWYNNDAATYAKLNELWRTLNELNTLLELLREAERCVHIRLLIKLYHIGVSTLTDVLASLINEVFDLGYPERDIKLDAITRNRHVKASGLTDIVTDHVTAVEKERYAKIRNDIVHRNKLPDPELDALEAREADLMSSAALFHEAFGDATPDVYFARESLQRELVPDVRALVVARTHSLTGHLNAMKALLHDIDVALAHRIADGG